MSVVNTIGTGSIAMPRDPPHLHEWELRAVEFDTWGQVRFYECLSCPGVRYA